MTELAELDPSAFNTLISHLTDHNIPFNKYRKSVGDGRSQCWGIVRKRSLPPDLSRNSWNDPKLHYLLMLFARQYVPIEFTSIQVNDSLKCARHTDKHNVGQSYIVGFGPYQGGALMLYLPEGQKEFNIRHRPLLFDGSKIEHETTDFTGRRWSIVFHTQESPKMFPAIRTLRDYEAITKDGGYVIAFYRDGYCTEYLNKKNGLPHPLKGRKKVKPEIVDEFYDPLMSPAQNLIFASQSLRGNN